MVSQKSTLRWRESAKGNGKKNLTAVDVCAILVQVVGGLC